MKVSVVIPCYNARRYIDATLRSVAAQQWPDVEVIVVDDGSTDGSAQHVEAHHPAVRLLRQPNQGVAAARNAGISAARSHWIAFLDADDLWLPGKLAAQFELLGRSPGSRMAYSAWHVWTSQEPTPDAHELAEFERQRSARSWDGPSGWIYPQLLLDCEVWTTTVLAERSLLDELGGFDAGLRIGEDYDLWLRASRLTTIVRVPQPLALYRMHPSSITKAAPPINYQAQVLERAISRWGLSAPDGSRADPSAVNRALARCWSDYAGAPLGAGDLERARHGSAMSLRVEWRQTLGWKLLLKSCLRGLRSGAVPHEEAR